MKYFAYFSCPESDVHGLRAFNTVEEAAAHCEKMARECGPGEYRILEGEEIETETQEGRLCDGRYFRIITKVFTQPPLGPAGLIAPPPAS